ANTVGATARRARNAVAYAGTAHAVQPRAARGRGTDLGVTVGRAAMGRDGIAHHAGGAAGTAIGSRARTAGSTGTASAGARGCVTRRSGFRLTGRRAHVPRHGVAVVALLDRHPHDAVAAYRGVAEGHGQRNQLAGLQ